MNKLGKREYIQLIAEAMVSEYGHTLIDYNTDVRMAKKVLKRLTPYLYFRHRDMSIKEFNQWRAELYAELGMD